MLKSLFYASIVVAAFTAFSIAAPETQNPNDPGDAAPLWKTSVFGGELIFSRTHDCIFKKGNKSTIIGQNTKRRDMYFRPYGPPIQSPGKRWLMIAGNYIIDLSQGEEKLLSMEAFSHFELIYGYWPKEDWKQFKTSRSRKLRDKITVERLFGERALYQPIDPSFFENKDRVWNEVDMLKKLNELRTSKDEKVQAIIKEAAAPEGMEETMELNIRERGFYFHSVFCGWLDENQGVLLERFIGDSDDFSQFSRVSTQLLVVDYDKRVIHVKTRYLSKDMKAYLKGLDANEQDASWLAITAEGGPGTCSWVPHSFLPSNNTGSWRADRSPANPYKVVFDSSPVPENVKQMVREKLNTMIDGQKVYPELKDGRPVLDKNGKPLTRKDILTEELKNLLKTVPADERPF